MANNLPPVGVRAVIENQDGFNKGMDKLNKKVSDASKSLEKSAGSSSVLSKALGAITGKLGSFNSEIGDLVSKAQGAQSGLAAMAGELGGVSPALLGAAAGAAAAAAAFVALGVRGAALVGISQSFDRLTQSVNITSEAMLGRLRTAAAGTISDFELMQKTNFALAGATGAFGQAFGQSLPRLLEIARVQARATGQDINYMLDSIVTGVKRGSPLILDNLGFTIKISEANAAYAASIGKTVEQMTAEDKQIAVLNALLAAGETSMATYAGVQETAAEKISRLNSTITNMLDTLAIGVQPAFSMVLDVINRFMTMIGGLVTAINPLISSFLEAGAAIITGPLQAILALAEPIASLIGWFLTLATVILQPVLRAISAFGTAIGTGVTRVMQFIGGFFQQFGLTFQTLALSVGVSGGAIMAAFGNALMQGYNAVVAPAVLFIATSIADFLVGQSPPPKGPLSQIDKGGANVMTAWAEGFAGASLQPVNEVAGEVNRVLGDIGKMSLPAVEARIGQLDAALQPFNDQLTIVKANFDAISDPAKAALDSIDRQMKKAMQALSEGQAGSAEAVRALDAQREKIEKALDSQQDLVDQAQIQQALAKSQQGEERALLSIQQARLKAAETLTKTTDEGTKAATKAAADAAKGAGGGAQAAPVETGGGGGAGFDMSLPSVNDLISGQSAVDQMGADLATGFTAGFEGSLNQGTVAAFDANNAAIQAQTSRIAQANPGQRIADAFAGIGAGIQTALTDASTVISDWVEGIVSPDRQGSIVYSFNALANGDWSALVYSLTSPFSDAYDGIQTGLTDVSTLISDWIEGIVSPDREGSIAYSFNALANGDWSALTAGLTAPFSDLAEDLASFDITTALAGVGLSVTTFFTDLNTSFTTFVTSLTDPANPSGLIFGITSLPELLLEPFATLALTFTDQFSAISDGLFSWLDSLFNPETTDSIVWTMRILPTRIGNALRDLGSTFDDNVLTPITETVAAIGANINHFFAESGEGTLSGMLDSGVAWFTALPQRIFDALASMGQGFFGAFVIPIVGGINQAIEGIETFVNNSLSGLNTVIGSLQGLAEAVGFGDQFAEIQGTLAQGITLPRISTPAAPVATFPGASSGGLFGVRVHKGEQVMGMGAGQRMGVFPADVTRNLDLIASVLAQPQGMMLPEMAGGSVTNNTTNNNQFVANNPASAGNFLQQVATFRAMRGAR